MSYALATNAIQQLVTKPEEIDPGVKEVRVTLSADQYGQDALFFLIILSDNFPIDRTGLQPSHRLRTITDRLWGRILNLDLPFYPFFEFILEKERSMARRAW